MAESELSNHEQERSVPAEVYTVRAGAIGGLLGGIAMGLVALAYGAFWRGSPWLPVNVIAATVLRDLQSANLDQLAQFNATALAVGLVLHFVLAIALGILFALLLPTLPGSPVFWAIIVGPLLWMIATVITLPLVNPLGAHVIDWPSFVGAHLAYGLVMGLYVVRTEKVPA